MIEVACPDMKARCVSVSQIEYIVAGHHRVRWRHRLVVLPHGTIAEGTLELVDTDNVYRVGETYEIGVTKC